MGEGGEPQIQPASYVCFCFVLFFTPLACLSSYRANAPYYLSISEISPNLEMRFATGKKEEEEEEEEEEGMTHFFIIVLGGITAALRLPSISIIIMFC